MKEWERMNINSSNIEKSIQLRLDVIRITIKMVDFFIEDCDKINIETFKKDIGVNIKILKRLIKIITRLKLVSIRIEKFYNREYILLEKKSKKLPNRLIPLPQTWWWYDNMERFRKIRDYLNKKEYKENIDEIYKDLTDLRSIVEKTGVIDDTIEYDYSDILDSDLHKIPNEYFTSITSLYTFIQKINDIKNKFVDICYGFNSYSTVKYIY